MIVPRTERELKDRGYKIQTLHRYGYRRGDRPDYKVVELDSDDRKGSPYDYHNASPWLGLVKWDAKRKQWGAHPPLKGNRHSMRVRPVRLCDTRTEAAHVLVDAAGKP